MIRYRAETTIAKPLDQVFRFVEDVSQYPKWMGIVSAKMISPGRMHVNSQAGILLRMGPMHSDMVFEITEHEPNRKMTWKSVSKGPLDWDATLQFSSKGDSSTTVTNTGHVGLDGLWRLFKPLMAGEVRNGEQKELEKLKKLIESGS